MSIYDIIVEDIHGFATDLDEHRNKLILIVNIASKCGYTPQLLGLEKLHKKYKDKGFAVLGFPCNQFLRQAPGTNTELLHFCRESYGVTFPVYGKLNVKGLNQSKLYKHLVSNSPIKKNKKVKWNFEKFLINKNGEVINRYMPRVVPEYIDEDIKFLLQPPKNRE